MIGRTRTWLAALLGLLLLLQGYAVAAAPRASAAEAPCPMHAQGLPDAAQPDCCDADCPSMATCLLAHFVAIPELALAIVPAADERPAFMAARARAGNPASPLRPPIALHA